MSSNKRKHSRKTRRDKAKNFQILKHNGPAKNAELYRQIRTNIEYSTAAGLKVIAITSSVANEAKTVTAINLAYAFAQKYKKVLLIDCDLRKRTIHRYLDISNNIGITDAIIECARKGKMEENYVQTISGEDDMWHLDIIPSGTKVANPTEMLGGKSFYKIMNDLREIYDVIILDCSPVLLTADPIPVGLLADGTVFITSAQDAKKADVVRAVDVLKRNGVKILGSVLTKAPENKRKYYYYY